MKSIGIKIMLILSVFVSIFFTIFGAISIETCNAQKGQVTSSVCYNSLNVYCNYTVEYGKPVSLCIFEGYNQREFYIYEIIYICENLGKCTIPKSNTLWYIFLIIGAVFFVVASFCIAKLCRQKPVEENENYVQV